ncbi:MAG: DegT/DnrJ/EryC1/StrS family aminotransferase [Candidatus Omnitrophica bacterium]|nr:DegT/DnrJ/EryC1/StrS family aminotransferase [Candidatus Omnitrophota bacterium]
MKRTGKNTGKKILVCDLKREHGTIRGEVMRSVKRVLDSGWYILGKELEAFENEFAEYIGSSNAVGVASGTEGLQLALMALAVGRGDEVITAVNTAIPTAMAIVSAGATPKFVDIDEDTFNLDIRELERAITGKTKAIVPVHLYGNPCDIGGVMKIARKHGLAVIEDACQAHGASHNSRKVGSFGDLGAFSFYPTKNLGCYGDGGMVVTNNGKLAAKLRLLRNYGQATRYSCDIEGINSRLDEIQAAILRGKLRRLDRFNKRRSAIARLYGECLKDIGALELPSYDRNSKHVFHLYVIRCEKRDMLRDFLLKNGIETQIHYPVPLHLQGAFKGLGYRAGDFPRAEALSRKILTLPVFPALTDGEVMRICNCVRRFYNGRGRRLS